MIPSESRLYPMLTDFFDIPSEQAEIFLSKGVLKHSPKGEIVFHAGTVCQRLLFLEEGYIRGFRLIDGKDITHHFYAENWFVADYESFLRDKPGNLYLKTLTDVSYYEYSKYDLAQLYRHHPALANVGRIIAERAFLVMVDRMVDLQTNHLQERVSKLLRQHPGLFQLAPQKHIASYLGVAEQSLSRVLSMRKAKS